MLKKNITTRIIFFIILFFTSNMLTSCGWHLRGTQGSNIDLQSIDITYKERNAALISIAKRLLDQRGIKNNKDSQTKLTIEREILNKRALAYTATGIIAQYQLSLTLEYSTSQRLIDNQQEKRKVTARRNYDFDPSLLSSETREEDALIKEMRTELLERILRTMASVQP